MKRIGIFCCVLLLLALLPVTAHADVIYEPFDSFYEAHRGECTYVGRSYTATAPNGTLTLYGSPEDPGVEKAYPNGTALYVSYTYQAADGVLWACCDKWDEDVTGWAPMEYLELIYDGISFEEEYGDQFVPVQVTLAAEEWAGKEVYFWQYPGSSTYILMPMEADYLPDFQTSYTDSDGAQWVRCSYYMGIKGYWVNLNDPTADYETLFPDAAEETVPTETEPAPTAMVEEIKPAGNGLKLTVTAAVAAVVIVTAALLIVLKKKRL